MMNYKEAKINNSGKNRKLSKKDISEILSKQKYLEILSNGYNVEKNTHLTLKLGTLYFN